MACWRVPAACLWVPSAFLMAATAFFMSSRIVSRESPERVTRVLRMLVVGFRGI